MIDKLTDDLMSLQFMGRHGEINKDWIVLDRPIRPKETRISPIPSTTRLIYDYSNARDSSIFVEKHELAYDYLVNKYPNNFERVLRIVFRPPSIPDIAANRFKKQYFMVAKIYKEFLMNLKSIFKD